MDGIALDSAAVRGGSRRFAIQASQAAGDTPLALSSRSQCIEVMTGTVLPGGCDAVVAVEQIHAQDGIAELDVGLVVEPGRNVHRRGSDARQGSLLLQTGARLGAPEIAIAASAGMARIRVSSQPAIVVISTGNELVEPDEPLLPHQVRRSNAYGVVAALRRHGFQRVADDHLRDDPSELRSRLEFHLHTHDVLVLSGGISMGRLDLVPQVLEELGVRLVFHHVAQRPGKPMGFGVTQAGAAVFALPGNPVSTLACLARYVVPALYIAMGESRREPERIAIAAPIDVTSALETFMPVRLAIDEWGRTWAVPSPTNGSGDFTSLAGTAGFVALPPGPHTYPKGFVTRLHRW
jgi:molybdopterin molybdotransferase